MSFFFSYAEADSFILNKIIYLKIIFNKFTPNNIIVAIL